MVCAYFAGLLKISYPNRRVSMGAVFKYRGRLVCGRACWSILQDSIRLGWEQGVAY